MSQHESRKYEIDEFEVVSQGTGQQYARAAMQAQSGPETAQEFLASGQGGPLVRTYLTESYLRRLGRLPLNDEEDLEQPD